MPSVAWLVVVMTTAAPSAPRARTPQNILVITVDTLRADHLSCYGYRKIRTPNLDRLAARGVLFEQAMATSPWTTPSIVSLMTSVYPSVHRADKEVALDAGFTTLAEVLQVHGFRTQAFVTNPHLSEETGLAQGFDEFELLGSNVMSKYVLGRDSAENITDEALEWLGERDEDPFFLWMHYNDPHIPYGSRDEDDLPVATGKTGRIGSYFYDVNSVRDGSLALTREEKSHLETLYDVDLLYLDLHLGRLFRAMSRQGLLRSTIVVLTADHGEEFWEHHGFEHGHTLYRELIQVPLIVVAPGLAAGSKRIAAQVRLVDIFPTLLDIVGIDARPPLQGRSLVSLVRAGHEEVERPALSEALLYGQEKKSIRKGPYTLIYDPKTRATELYETSKDPGEVVDRAPFRRDVVARLLADLEGWQHECRQLRASLPLGDELPEADMEEHEATLRALGYIQ